VIAIARRDVKKLRVLDDSASEDPKREFFWTIAAGAGGVFLLVQAFTSGSTADWVAGAVFSLVAAVLIRNQLKRITVVEVTTAGGKVRISLEARLSADQVATLNRRVRDELDWPVGD
jgi:hypothetical protein